MERSAPRVSNEQFPEEVEEVAEEEIEEKVALSSGQPLLWTFSCFMVSCQMRRRASTARLSPQSLSQSHSSTILCETRRMPAVLLYILYNCTHSRAQNPVSCLLPC